MKVYVLMQGRCVDYHSDIKEDIRVFSTREKAEQFVVESGLAQKVAKGEMIYSLAEKEVQE